MSDNEAELSEDSDKQTKVSNRTLELSTSLEELSEHGNEASEPGEGSECALVVDKPPNSKISTTEAVKQTEVEMACIKEYSHYTIERELDNGEKPSNEHDGFLMPLWMDTTIWALMVLVCPSCCDLPVCESKSLPAWPPSTCWHHFILLELFGPT